MGYDPYDDEAPDGISSSVTGKIDCPDFSLSGFDFGLVPVPNIGDAATLRGGSRDISFKNAQLLTDVSTLPKIYYEPTYYVHDLTPSVVLASLGFFEISESAPVTSLCEFA